MLKREELFKIYGYCGAIWSTFKLPENDLEANLFDLTWYDILCPYNLDIILLAIKEYAKKSDFCNIAKIGEECKRIQKISEGKYIDDEAVLSEIRKAIMQCQKDEAFEHLSPFAKEVVEGAWQLYKWGMLETGQVDTVIMSNLRKKIEKLKQRQEDKNVLYELQAISHFSNQMLEEGKDAGSDKRFIESN